MNVNPSFNEWITEIINCEINIRGKPIYESQKIFLKKYYETETKLDFSKSLKSRLLNEIKELNN